MIKYPNQAYTLKMIFESGLLFEQGDLSECFKSRALSSLDDFFAKDAYKLSEHTRVVRMPSRQLRLLKHEPYEFSSETRAEDSEWDQFVKFLLRKVFLAIILTYTF